MLVVWRSRTCPGGVPFEIVKESRPTGERVHYYLLYFGVGLFRGLGGQSQKLLGTPDPPCALMTPKTSPYGHQPYPRVTQHQASNNLPSLRTNKLTGSYMILERRRVNLKQQDFLTRLSQRPVKCHSRCCCCR